MVKINKKGISEEGTKFNLKQLTMLIVFLVVVAIGIIILIPRLTADQTSSTTSNFGKYIWDVLTGGNQ